MSMTHQDHPAWFRFWQWATTGGGWQALAAITYLTICIFDFMVVPAWVGIVRASNVGLMEQIHLLSDLDPGIQHQIVSLFTYHHEPFTLKGGGLFHLSFGALLTGSTFNRSKRD